MNSVSKKLALVIGGGDGIGAACCRVMSNRGWKVAVADLNFKAAQGVASEVDGNAYEVDVASLAAVEQLAADVEAKDGQVYSLVVSSGAFQNKMAPSEFPMDLWRKIVSVNLEGTYNANQVFGTLMAERGGGNIVNISSILAHVSNPNFAYGPSKAAILNLTRSLAVHWGHRGVRVNSVSPGMVLVPRVLARPAGRYAADVDKLSALNRRIEPNEIGESVEFLASDRASAITGTDLLVDAGLLAATSWGIYGGKPDGPD